MQSLSSRLARGALDAAPDAMIIIDGDGFCDILEGGEAAFRERARRLRVRFER